MGHYKGHQRMKKLRVLVSAYACEPGKGSEPGVGWNWAKQIARFHEVWVITRANNRELLQQELLTNPNPNLHFIYYDVPKWLSFWKKKERGLHFYYLLWQIGAFNIAKTIQRRVRFDLVHHITFGNLWLPTFLPFLKVPFVWGPLGGGEQVPAPFRTGYSFRAKIQEFVRDAILASLKINPYFLAECKKARLIVVRTVQTQEVIPKRFQYKVVRMIETGVDAGCLPPRKAFRNDGKVQIVSVGRLIHWKGFDLAIKAFAKSVRSNGNLNMVIIGDGQDKQILKAICEEEDIASKVLFAGQVDHERVLQIMCESDIFLFPSLKEGGAWVFYEAMLLELPVICLDIAGAAEVITSECGISVTPLTPEQTIDELSDAIIKLAANPKLKAELGGAGRKRVEEEYSWSSKGHLIRELYDRCVKTE
jgi:glycosyltransferase involved in cell wall biosynthesis